MKLIFCATILVAIVSDFVKADEEQELFTISSNEECIQKSSFCRNQMTTVVADEEISGLCKSKPLSTTATKCLIECQMRRYKWINDDGFQTANYLKFIKSTSLGCNEAYVQAAENAAALCKEKKAAYDDSCETAYLIIQCLQDEGDKQQHLNLGYCLFNVDPYFLELK